MHSLGIDLKLKTSNSQTNEMIGQQPTTSNAANQATTKPMKDKDFLIKNLILDWCSYSTAHGISNISRAKNKVVLITWICFYLASIIFCLYNIINITVAFSHFNVLINMELVNEPPIDFPAVTVCNLNPFDKIKANAYINQVLAENNLTYVKNLTLIDYEPDLIYKLIKARVFSDANLTKEGKSNLSFSLSYMILNCRFKDFRCNESDFTSTYNFDYGNCYTFNSGYDSFGNKVPVKKISEAGSDKSFRLELYLGDEYYQSEFLLNSGARVIVHNQSITPLYESEGRDVASGYLTNIGIIRSFFDKLDRPYSDCVKNTRDPSSYESDFYKAIFNSLNISLYRQKNCLPLCLQTYLREKCECVDGSLPFIGRNVSICNNLTALNCIKNKKVEYFDNEALASKCLKQCPLECDSTNFQLSMSVSRYPSMYYTQYLSNKINFTEKLSTKEPIKDVNITKNIIAINVFYDDLTTTYVKEIPEINGDQLLGNIGGNLALFAGMSALSFVEIIELIIDVVLIKLN